MSEETAKFNKAADLFFGMNPSNPNWILVAFYYAKHKGIEIRDNYADDDTVLVRLDRELLGGDKAKEWDQAGIINQSAVVAVSEELKDTVTVLLDKSNHIESGNSFFELRQMDPCFLMEIVVNLLAISDEWYDENGVRAYNGLVSRIFGKSNKCMEAQPKELVELVSLIADICGGSVYLPYAGYGEFSQGIRNATVCCVQEMTPMNYAVAKLNYLMNGKVNADCKLGNPVTEWKGSEGYDYIIANPPFGYKCVDSQYGSCDYDFLFRSANDTRVKAIGVYPAGITFRRNRELPQLVETDLIEAVILLPGGLYEYVGIQMAVVVVNKEKVNKGRIQFIDARSCCKRSGRKNVLKVEDVLDLYRSETESDLKRGVDINTIAEKEYDLFPLTYLKQDAIEVPEGMVLRELGDLLETADIQRARDEEEGKVFSTRKESKAYTVKVSYLEKDSIKPSFSFVNEDCIMIRKSGSFSATLLTTNERVYFSPIYVPFRLADDTVEPLYLLTELHKPYFAEQLEAVYRGAAVKNMNVRDFLQLKIMVPTERKKQYDLIIETGTNYIAEEAARYGVILDKRMDAFVKNQRQRKHSVAQVLNKIKPAVYNIEAFIHKNETFSKDSVVSVKSGKTLEQYVASLLAQVEKVVDMVDRFTDQETYGNAEPVELRKFLEEYCDSMVGENYSARFVNKINTYDSTVVMISKRDLSQVLDNLFTNAIEYGFKEDRKDYEIRVNLLQQDDQNIRLEVINNGIPASKTIEKDQIFTWGIGNGTGTGCWQAKEICEHFGGTISYEEYPEDEQGFVCEFDIVLPKINNE